MTACEVAFSVYKNKSRKSAPYVRRSFLKIDNQSYRLNHLILRIPARPNSYIYLTLQASEYHLSFISDPNLKRGEITITDRTVNIAFSRIIPLMQPEGTLGIDLNERNLTWSDTNGKSSQEDTSRVVELKERYKEVRSKIGRNTRCDKRIAKHLHGKYGKRERNRTIQELHRVSKIVVEHAKSGKLAIVLENLKGIRKLYRKGNGQGTLFRERMNSWLFSETQRQIEYKAAWLGVPVYHVNPRGTSRHCPDCGSLVVPLQDRKLYCTNCDKTWDRDVLA
jgi:putative transposase